MINQIVQFIVLLAAATNYEVANRDGVLNYHSVQSGETLRDFKYNSEKWVKCSRPRAGEIAGFNFISWDSVQMDSDKDIQSITVVDLGVTRLVIYGVDLYPHRLQHSPYFNSQYDPFILTFPAR